jgi:gliding motility-associated-like protein
MVLTINPGATANAGPSTATICAGTTYSVPGSIGGSASSVTWTSSGTGSFSSTTSVTPTYTPSAADIAAGSVTLTMTTNDPAGPCPAAISSVVVTISPAATANAAANASICANQTYTLSGSIGGSATSSTWTTSGSGIFSNTAITNPVYTPSASDISAGSVTLTITTNDPAGSCPAVSDPMVLTITPLQNAAFTFGSATYCQTGTNPTPVITGVAGGTFSSSPAGLSINSSTGAINLAASSLNTYTITYTTPGPCPNSSAVSITITLAPSATFSYSGPYCTSGADPSPSFTGSATAGTFTATPAGLTFVNVNTGQIDVSATTPGTYTVTNTITASGGCAAASATASVTINAAATANAGSNTTICAGSTYTLAGSIGGSATTLTWTSSGSGSFSSTTSATAVYTPSATDISAGSVTLTLTTNDPAGPCPFVTSTMVITISPAATASAGSPATICAGSTYTLAGVIGGSAISSTWSTSGTGTFNNTALLGAIYTPSAADISGGSVTLTLTTNDPSGPCPAVTSTLILTINPAATVSAGSNATICSGLTYTLAGTIGGGASNATWTTSGSGTFSSATALNATYTPSASDISAGSVTLTLTTNDPAGPCAAATSAMVLTINPAATVSAGSSAAVCSGSTYSLSGTMGGGATSITWSTSGTGTFNNTASTTAIYTPSAADISAGSVVLTITTNDPAGPCGAVTNTMTLTINSAATVTAGANATICSGSTYPLAGSMGGGASSITWSTSGSGTFSSASSTTATYTPSAADISAGSVVLTITTNDPAGPCPAVTSAMTLTINPAATVSAGAAAAICAGTTYTLAGTMGGSSTVVTWTTSGSGTFSNPNVTTPIYTPSAADITAGSVTLTITTNDPVGPCPPVNNSMVLTINPAPTVSAGGNATICSSSTYALTGTMGGSATSVTWTTTGSGTFSSTTALNPTYIPSAADISAGSVSLTITTNNPAGPCNAISDVMTLTINPAATVNAGSDLVICSNNVATLAGSFGGSATNVTWSSSGSGTFGSITSAATSYTPSAADITAGTVTLTLTSNDPAGICGVVTDNMVLTINLQDNATFSYPSSTFCQTGTDPVATIVGGASGTFVATPSGLVFLNATTGLIDVSASTLGNYFVTFNTSGICPNNSTINVTVTAAPNATFSYGTPFCQTGTTSPVFPSGASAGTFSASPAGLVFVNTSTGQIDLATSTPGTYTITNTIAAASGCASATATSTIVVDPIATASAGVDGSICEASAYNLAGTMGGSSSSIAWSSSGTGVFSNASSLTSTYTPSSADVATGSVTLTITTNNPAGVCSEVTDIMILTITQLDVATFNYTGSTFCQTGTNPVPVITGLAGGTFSSSPAGLMFVSTATGEVDLVGSTLGTYTVAYTTNGVCPNVSTATITITNAPSAALSYTSPFCSTDADPLPTFPVGSSGGAFSSSPSGLTINTSTGEVDLSASTAGTYTITNTIAASGGCATATANATIVINQAATVDAGNNGTICAGSAYAITGAVFGGSATSSTWTSSGTGTFDNAAILGAVYTPSSADTAAGTVTLYLTTDNPSGSCSAVVDSLIITINNTPSSPVVANPAPVCAGSPVSSLTVVGATGTVTWYSDAALTTIASTGNPFSPGSITTSVSYWVTETSGACASSPAQVDIVVNALPVGNTSSLVVTSADCGTLTGTITGITITSGAAPFTYSWQDSTGAVVGTSLDLTGVGPGNYVLTVTDTNGCSIQLGGATGISVNSSSSVVASFTADPISGETPLAVTFTNTSIGASSYAWQFGTGDTSSVFSPSYIYMPLGQFTACLIASNAAGCADTACTEIDVFINSVFLIPNVFTPNDDNVNDMFTVQAVGLETMDAEVFNRWGQKEYEWHTTNGGWDGRTASGVPAPDGTYFYIIKAKGFDEKEYFQKGSFTLIR